MSQEIQSMMLDRRMIKNHDSQEYRDADKIIKKKFREAKETWLHRECKEIEGQFGVNNKVYQKINEISGSKFGCSDSGCIKAKDGTVLLENNDIKNRWIEYIGELFHDTQGALPHFPDSTEGPNVLKSEVQTAINMMRRNRAAGPDGIVVEMLEALEEYGVEKLTDIINRIYHGGDFPEDLHKSIFIALPKKLDAAECEQHRKISLMSHITKLILKILLLPAMSSIKPAIGVEQFGFVGDVGFRNAIFLLRMVTERAVEMKKDVFMCFIDYSKGFDKVRHDELFKDIRKLGLHGKDFQSFYWKQTACIRIDGECTDYTSIKRGVRQGCVMSPDLFNYYS